MIYFDMIENHLTSDEESRLKILIRRYSERSAPVLQQLILRKPYPEIEEAAGIIGIRVVEMSQFVTGLRLITLSGSRQRAEEGMMEVAEKIKDELSKKKEIETVNLIKVANTIRFAQLFIDETTK